MPDERGGEDEGEERRTPNDERRTAELALYRHLPI